MPTATSAKDEGLDAPALHPLPDARLVVHKTRRTLEVFSGDEQVAVYPVDIGQDADTDKQREGDRCTPLGHFYVCMRNPNSAYTRSLGISYPNAEDATRGLREGLITAEQHEDLVAAERQGVCPDWYTPLGGEICIHGNGGTKGWTLGCIALRDADMLALYERIPMKTPVEIVP